MNKELAQQTLVEVTAAQIEEAKDASWKRYWDGLNKQDRPGWTGGKCPVNEYYGIINELGSANYLGIPTDELVLYSPNYKDYQKPDAGIWEFKAGDMWTIGDVRKGVRYVLWGKPQQLNETFECGIETCGHGIHQRLSGLVLIRGWSNTKDTTSYHRYGDRFYPKPMHRLNTLPWVVKH